MKQYHTTIDIDASAEAVWNELTNFKAYPQWNPIVGSLKGDMKTGSTIATYIVPLGKTYYPTILNYEKNKELIWLGVQGAKFLMAGKHYYKLEKVDTTKTRLLHGEYFTGLFSLFISKPLLAKMERAFLDHNNLLKKRVENGKR